MSVRVRVPGWKQRHLRIAPLATLLTVCFVLAAAFAAPQQSAAAEKLRLAVIGDSLALDLWFGLQRHYRRNKNIEVVKFTKSASGLVRDDNYDWNAKLKKFMREDDFDVAVVVIGGNDRQSIRHKGKRLQRFTDPWKEEYARRVGVMIDLIKQETDDVFWVSLPSVRSNRMARDYLSFNEIYERQAKAKNINFVDIWPLFRDKNGDYTSFGPDVKGVKRRLRKDDGLHFTTPGQGRFAEEVAKLMRKSVEQSATDLYRRLAATSAPAE